MREPKGSTAVGDFWRELKRRKVVRVALVYAVVAWALVEASSVILPGLLMPEWSERLVGFPRPARDWRRVGHGGFVLKS